MNPADRRSRPTGSLKSCEWTLHCGDLDRKDVQELLAFHVMQLRGSSPADACHVLPADGLRAPEVTFWSLREDGRLLAIGALKELSSAEGELKSMRTAPHALRRGAGAAILRAITAEARRRGYARLCLETGSTAEFGPALAFYRRNGFEPCGPFAAYRPTPFTRFLSKTLDAGRG